MIVLSAYIDGRSCLIVVIMDMAVIERGFTVHVMSMMGIARVTACHALIIMPVPVIDCCFA
jgi:hypothetical protein